MKASFCPPPEPEIRYVHIQMTEDEAKTLHAIMGCIGGPPEGRRGHMDRLNQVLTRVLGNRDTTLLDPTNQNVVYFK